LDTPHDEFEPISAEERWAIFDAHARRFLNMSGQEFLAAWKEGKFTGKEDDPDVLDVAMLLPLVETGTEEAAA
jgi:hypothetical protein